MPASGGTWCLPMYFLEGLAHPLGRMTGARDTADQTCSWTAPQRQIEMLRAVESHLDRALFYYSLHARCLFAHISAEVGRLECYAVRRPWWLPLQQELPSFDGPRTCCIKRCKLKVLFVTRVCADPVAQATRPWLDRRVAHEAAVHVTLRRCRDSQVVRPSHIKVL